MGKVALTAMVVVAAVVIAGCATVGGGASPEEQIRAEIAKWSEAFIAKDMDTLMTFYSEDFSHYEYNDKAGMRSFLQDAIDMGYLNDPAVDTTAMVVVVDGDTAEAGPITLTASFGSAAINLDLKKQAAGWKITTMDVEQQ